MGRMSHRNQERTERRISAAASLMLCALTVLAQIAVTLLLTRFLKEKASFVYGFLQLIGAAVAIRVYQRSGSPSYKLSWMCLLLILPVAGMLLFWVRVSLALLPALILFGVAGLCCCGGALCAGILALRGLCDGAALGALVLVGRSPIPFLLRTALLLILRLALSLWCRATAGNISDPALQHPSDVRGLSPLMQRHLAGLLAATAAGAAVCGLYTALVFL